jgi:hypothetical protein
MWWINLRADMYDFVVYGCRPLMDMHHVAKRRQQALDRGQEKEVS